MTLFLLLVAIAALVPIFMVGLEAPRLGAAGIIVGGAIALLLAAAQFFGHHKAAAWTDRRGPGERIVGWWIGAYYCAILCGGIACGMLVRAVARGLSE